MMNMKQIYLYMIIKTWLDFRIQYFSLHHYKLFSIIVGFPGSIDFKMNVAIFKNRQQDDVDNYVILFEKLM